MLRLRFTSHMDLLSTIMINWISIWVCCYNMSS